mgnify:CR=1 FL=1
MTNRFQYRLSEYQKNEIAQNLIEILQKNANIDDQTRVFIGNWILTISAEKTKAFYDVWDIVLKNFLPTTRPVLFRSCKRNIKKNKIASFTGRLECARRFSKNNGFLIICDTNESLQSEEIFHKPGEYENTFYPLVSVLIKAKELGGCGFSERILNDYIGEDEYIMKTNKDIMSSVKWIKHIN